MNSLNAVSKISDVKQILNHSSEISLYGAGYYLDMFLNEIENIDSRLLTKVSKIIVSQEQGNRETIKGIKVVGLDSCYIEPDDIIFLTVGELYIQEICELLDHTGATVYELDFNMFQKEPYIDIKEKIQPFIDEFPANLSNLNLPDENDIGNIAWSFWWQGADEAPELVKACLHSQKRNLPYGVQQIVITKNNFAEYISIPNNILEKVDNGSITLTTLSDIFRAALLYKYGGFWMDATLLVVQPISEDILKYPVYTRNLPGVQYCTNVMWADWFLYSKKGYKLFQFLMEAFFYYYSKFEKIKYYFTVDYFIAIACNSFEDIEKDMKSIPENNIGALELARHLPDKFDEQRYDSYIKDSFIQKLSYKIDWANINPKDTIYEHILQMEKINESKL